MWATKSSTFFLLFFCFDLDNYIQFSFHRMSTAADLLRVFMERQMWTASCRSSSSWINEGNERLSFIETLEQRDVVQWHHAQAAILLTHTSHLHSRFKLFYANEDAFENEYVPAELYGWRVFLNSFISRSFTVKCDFHRPKTLWIGNVETKRHRKLRVVFKWAEIIDERRSW